MTLASSQLLDQLKALSHEIRYDLVRYLGGGERCVCDLEVITGLPQPKVSYHLSVLKEAGLVISEQRGKNMYYRLQQPALFKMGGSLLTEIFDDPVHLAREKNSLCS